MVHDIMPGTQEELNQHMTAAYIGFDPTADSLHIGNNPGSQKNPNRISIIMTATNTL